MLSVTWAFGPPIGSKMLGHAGNRRLRIRKFDPIAESSEFADYSCRPALLGLFANRRAPFLVTEPLLQHPPDQAAKPMGNHSDRLVMPQARHIAAIENLEDASFVLDRRVGRLVENAPHMAIALWRPVAVAHPRTLMVAGAGTHPEREVCFGGKGRCRGAHLGNDLRRRIHSQTGHLCQPLYLVLVRAEQIGHLLIELVNLLLDKLNSSSAAFSRRRYTGLSSWHAPSASRNCSGVARKR
jgi:hypothetical protein